MSTENVSKLKPLEKRKKLRLSLRMKDLVLNFSLRTWDTFLDMLAINLKWCCEENDLTIQNLLENFSAYTLS